MSEPSDFTRVPARWRIVGWLLFTAAIGLVALIVTVNSTLQAQAAQQSNDDVGQELHEFSDFVSPRHRSRHGGRFHLSGPAA